MDKRIEAEIKEVMKYHQNWTVEKLKKSIRRRYPNEKIYNEDIERLMIEAWKEMRAEKEIEDEER